MKFLEELIKNNQYPIIFIGSGITQRYFNNAPTWEDLLKIIWEKLYDEEAYYTKYHEIAVNHQDNFDVYTKLATYLEREIDQAFYEKKIEIDGLFLKQAHEGKISPFRKLIANCFENLELKEEMQEELVLFRKMLSKARLIITTNYDTFIEDCFQKNNQGIKVNVGNKGLFTKTSDYGELFKIHGSIKDVNSISFTETDYLENEKKSPIVNAKILSNLTESPIVFLGYSLNDKNIRKLLVDFFDNTPYENIDESVSRIAVVEYDKGESNIVEYISSTEKEGVHYTALKTDNYGEIYTQIARVEQGISPVEIAKYERVFRKIIQIKGQEKELETVIANFVDISSLSDEEIRNKPLVVAFGDNKYIYKIPTYADYMRAYFGFESEMPIEIIFKFLTLSPRNTPIPFKKYESRIERMISQNVSEKDREKYSHRVNFNKERDWTFFKQEAQGKLTKELKGRKITKETPEELFNSLSENEDKKINYILAHIDEFSKKDMLVFVEKLLTTDGQRNVFKTNYRKLYMAYSLIYE